MTCGGTGITYAGRLASILASSEERRLKKTEPETRKRNQKKNAKENGTFQIHKEIKARAPRTCARVLSPAFYSLQRHKMVTGNPARDLLLRVLLNYVNGVLR